MRASLLSVVQGVNVAEEQVPVFRRTARVLPVDDAGRVLLLEEINPSAPDRPYWCTIGGGLQPGETLREAAARELAEEAGIQVPSAELVGPLASETARFAWGRYDVTLDQTFFAVRVGEVKVSLAGLEDVERQTTRGYGWWTTAALQRSDQATLNHVLPMMERALTQLRP